MQATRGNPFMKKGQSKNTDWFRFENAHKDEENATAAETHIYIYGEIGDSWWGDSTSANDFIKLLSGVKSDKIVLHLNSPGGSIFDGVAIYNALRDHSAEIEVRVDALAASAASFIAMSGDKVVMARGSMMMIHDGSTGAYGNAAYLRETADILDKLSNTVAGLYQDRAGETVDFWRALMIQEVWYDAQEAVDAGLADEVAGDVSESDLQDVQNKWDLSIFNYAGRNAAPDPMETRRRIANSLKEAPVSQPASNEVEKEQVEAGTPASSDPNNPDANPDAQTTSPEGEDEQQQAEGSQDGAEVPGDPAAPDNKSSFSPKNVAGQPIVFQVNGVETSDATVVQNRLNMLETFRNETLTQARKDFVAKLAADNKILQSQVPKLEAYALSLQNDEAYMAWTETFDDAPGLAMLGSHGGSATPAGRQTEAAEDADTEIQNARDVVKQHKIGGMPVAKIEQTPSFKKLMALDPTFKLSDL